MYVAASLFQLKFLTFFFFPVPSCAVYQLHKYPNPLRALHAWPLRPRVQETMPQLSLRSECALSCNCCGWATHQPWWGCICSSGCSPSRRSMWCPHLCRSMRFLHLCLALQVPVFYIHLIIVQSRRLVVLRIMACSNASALTLHCRCILHINSTQIILLS